MISAELKDKITKQTRGGQKLGSILQSLLALATPDVSLLTLEKEAQRLIKEAGGYPSFQTVEGYSWATCLCVNDIVVHGIPTEYSLRDGDVLTIDVGMLYDGYHTDTAWTKIIGNGSNTSEEVKTFLKIGEQTFWRAIGSARVGKRIGHISETIQKGIEGSGFSVVASLVGHGVGKELHEKPQIPGILKVAIDKTPELTPGMVIAIEVIYAQGKGEIVYVNNDGWTLGTKDESLSAVFEHTICIDEKGPQVLTQAEI